MSRRWEICPCCDGEGSIDALGVVSRDQFDDDAWDTYLEGGYNTHCGHCDGSGKTLATTPKPIIRFGSDGQKVVYADADDASEHRLRMAEGGC